ncbi:hypothetical protein GQ457_02G032620 [Hibiscus cannabinus]
MLLRDMALHIAKPGFLVKAGTMLRKPTNVQEWSMELENVSLMKNPLLYIPLEMSSTECPRLTTLLLSRCNITSIPEGFFKHMDARKLTLIDSLVAAAVGIIAQEVAGDVRMTNIRADEAERGITIKSTVAELELWVMKEYGVVESWTKVLTLHTVPRYALFPRVMWFRKNGEVLLHMHNAKIASLDLNSQEMEDSLYLNSQKIEPHVVDAGADLLSVRSYVESLVLLDKAVNVRS